ncbi:hypothetical protein ASPBRDRAFT_203894 [Aspergillus brasiliensis CBS 101740]|uniref:non-specific serine/threonine protein kinase n=1 Tax=Aspergillus brasiliensis (strain CBS 101740 / IMI 381727 / IBT 21946) TaxID=767769 RepID=A0A1L9UX66_ASPBC|nr:hypothetical protein ASPBRDRAFT_203894 [Aspergillus brasiliensis CBS 101740]
MAGSSSFERCERVNGPQTWREYRQEGQGSVAGLEGHNSPKGNLLEDRNNRRQQGLLHKKCLSDEPSYQSRQRSEGSRRERLPFFGRKTDRGSEQKRSFSGKSAASRTPDEQSPVEARAPKTGDSLRRRRLFRSQTYPFGRNSQRQSPRTGGSDSKLGFALQNIFRSGRPKEDEGKPPARLNLADPFLISVPPLTIAPLSTHFPNHQEHRRAQVLPSAPFSDCCPAQGVGGPPAGCWNPSSPLSPPSIHTPPSFLPVNYNFPGSHLYPITPVSPTQCFPTFDCESPGSQRTLPFVPLDPSKDPNPGTSIQHHQPYSCQQPVDSPSGLQDHPLPSQHPEFAMDASRGSRFLDPAVAALSKHKAEAIKLAREQGVAVQEMCRRAKTKTPPYEFEELIGKGSYGRVYKGHQLPSSKIVAIKVMDIDSLDYNTVRDFRDESIKDFIHEITVMKQVKDAGAKNINELIEAVSIHSQLWLVCEYCPGGSVRTLMRATGDRLEEKFIIPIARELAAGLRAIHDAGIIHRDIKAANILIHEEGRLQICDFGVAGVLQSQMDKRSTWIGTPHWMPPEMFATRGEAHKYGSEIDVWAYGCTLFEFATGNPPNSNLRERIQIGRQITRNTPKLDTDKYSDGLKSIVSFALESNPVTRPAMADILTHPYVADTEDAYPTASLSELVRIYYQWSQRGGQRISLFHPGGAAAAELPGAESDYEEDWNFSTTDGFERRFSVIDLDQLAASLAELEDQISPTTTPSPEHESSEEGSDKVMTPEEQANFDERVRRGAAAMEGLFDEDKPSYKYETKNDFVPIEPKAPASDLPLRTDTDRSSVTSTFIDIDIGSFDSSHYAAGATSAQPFQLADADTIRANRTSGRQHRNSVEGRSRSSSSGVSSNRGSEDMTFQPQTGPRPPTMDWKFPVFMQPPTEEAEPASSPEPETKPAEPDTSDKRATMEWTFPVMTAPADDAGASSDSLADTSQYDTLKAPIVDSQPAATVRRPSIGEPGDSRPSTSRSGESNGSETDYDPFRFDRPSTPPTQPPADPKDPEYPQLLNTFQYPNYDQSNIMDGPGPDEEEETDDVWQKPSEDTDDPSLSEPFPTAIPTKGIDLSLPFVPSTNSSVSESLSTARTNFPALTTDDGEPILFPELPLPQLELFMAGANDHAIAGELDRLLESFIDSLNSTGQALSRISIGPEVKEEVKSEAE